MTYPNGRVITYDYGTGGSLNDTISRLAAITDGGTTLEDYAYLGLGTVVRRGHPEPGVDLTYIKQTGEADRRRRRPVHRPGPLRPGGRSALDQDQRRHRTPTASCTPTTATRNPLSKNIDEPGRHRRRLRRDLRVRPPEPTHRAHDRADGLRPGLEQLRRPGQLASVRRRRHAARLAPHNQQNEITVDLQRHHAHLRRQRQHDHRRDRQDLRLRRLESAGAGEGERRWSRS